MTQPNLCFAVSLPSLRREPELVEQLDQPIDRRLLRPDAGASGGRCPAHARPWPRVLWRWRGSPAKAISQDIGQHSVAPSPAGVHPTDCAEQSGGRPGACGPFDAFDPAPSVTRLSR